MEPPRGHAERSTPSPLFHYSTYKTITMQDPISEKLNQSNRPTIVAASRLILWAAIGLWATTLLELSLSGGVGAALLNLAYYLPFVALPVALYMRSRPGIGEAMRLKPLPMLPMLSVALLALISVYAASIMAGLWSGLLERLGLPNVAGAAVPQSERELALSILSMAALPAVCEELLFRGLVLAAWEGRGTRYAIGVTALLFALLHGNLQGLPAYLLVGALAGFVTFALDSLYAGIVYHTIYNAACLAIPFLLRNSAGGELTLDAPMVFSLLLELTMLLALMAVILVSLRLRARREGIEPIPRIRRPLELGEKAMLAVAVLAMLATTVAVLTIAATLAV